jgi:hypothetical protein
VAVQRVSEFSATAPEQIEHFAKLLIRAPVRVQIFTEVYRGQRQRPRTAEEIAQVLDITAKHVLTSASPLATHGLFEKTKVGKLIAYKKYPEINTVKGKILSLAQDKKKMAKHATVRKPSVNVQVNVRHSPRNKVADAHTQQIYIDDIDNFAKVRQFPATKLPKKIPQPLPEEVFKYGVAQILGNRGTFKDWGGETNDMYSTNLKIRGKRQAVVFGFKGPGVKGKLTPGKMGTNGDQIQRLFNSSTASVFLVQYEGEIAESVPEQMRDLAVAKSIKLRAPVWWGCIAREDSARLRTKYTAQFEAAAKAHPRKRKKRTKTALKR